MAVHPFIRIVFFNTLRIRAYIFYLAITPKILDLRIKTGFEPFVHQSPFANFLIFIIHRIIQSLGKKNCARNDQYFVWPWLPAPPQPERFCDIEWCIRGCILAVTIGTSLYCLSYENHCIVVMNSRSIVNAVHTFIIWSDIFVIF